MSDFLMIDPVKVFQVNGEACPITPLVSTVAVGNNNSLLAAITGKRIRVMGYIAQSSAAGASQFQLKSASGGTVIKNWETQNGIAAAPLYLPIVNSGYCETNTGEGLFADVATSILYLTIFYITYTP